MFVDEQAGIVGGHAEKLPRDAPRLAVFAAFGWFLAPFGRGREGLRVDELEGCGDGGFKGRQGPASPTDYFGAGARLTHPLPNGRDSRPLLSVA